MSSPAAEPKRRPLSASLLNVFDPANHEVVRDIWFMDNFMDTPNGCDDVFLMLRYCRHLVQLSHYFQQQKETFPKLCHAMQFRVTMNSVVYHSSCHLLALLQSAMDLSALVCARMRHLLPPLQKDLTQPASKTPLDDECVPLLLISDLPGSESDLITHRRLIRQTIGVFYYCINSVIPNATFVMNQLNQKTIGDSGSSVGFSDHMMSMYFTLRTLGCWVQAACTSRAKQEKKYQDPAVRDADVSLLLKSCIGLVNLMTTTGIRVPRLAITLRQSARYEGDLRMADRLSQGDSVDMSMALAFLARAHAMPFARQQIELTERLQIACEIASVTACTWKTSELEECASHRIRAIDSANVNLVGDNLFEGNAFIVGVPLRNATAAAAAAVAAL